MKNKFTIVLFSLLSTVSLEIFAQAQLQLIHNSADPAALAVDVYIDGVLAQDDLYYTSATAYQNVAAGVTVNIGIAPATSASVADTLKNFEFQFNNAENYVALISGVIAPGSFATNPNGINTGLSLVVRNMAQTVSSNGTDVDFCFIHGATDAPQIDLLARLNGILVDDALYQTVSGYQTLMPATYTLDITPYNDNSNLLYTFTLDLSIYGGQALTIFATGFVDPLQNQNGAPFNLFLVEPSGSVTQINQAQLGRFQAIHNCADPALDSVDIYLGAQLVINDFKFRTATTFLDVPAGVPLVIGVAMGNSNSASDTIKAFSLTFENGKTYIGFASGVGNPANFAANPDGKNISFDLISNDIYRELSINSGEFDFLVEHGITDAPTVDVRIRNGASLFDNASYSAVSNYNSVPPGSYIIEVADSSGLTTFATFQADFSNYAGKAGTVFFSGFGDPVANQNGDSGAVYLALPDGSVHLLPQIYLSRLQVIHAASDPSAALVDIYADGNLLLNDFAFQSATPFVDVPAATTVNIGIAPSSSASVNDTIKNFPSLFDVNKNYVAIASGVINTANFANNPDGYPIDLSLVIATDVQIGATTSGNIDFITMHCVSDAPTVDLIANATTTVANDIHYSQLSPYFTLAANDYLFDVTDNGGINILVQFNAPLATYGGQSAVVFATGFVTPAANQNGTPVEMFAAFADGTVVPFTETTSITELNDASVSIYPNPVSEKLFIKLNNPDATTLTITDALGKIVYNENYKETALISVSVEKWSKGFYTAKIQRSDSVSVKKILVD